MTATSRCAALVSLAAAACAALWLAPQRASAQGSNVLIILDSSGSMAAKVGGQVKMELAQRVVADLVDNMPADMNVGLLVYGARSPRAKNDCGDIELIQPMGSPDAAALSTALHGVKPRGMTPIGGSLKRAAEVLKGLPGSSTIVLVSDGAESCHGDPCQVAREVHEATGIDVRVHVVGLDVAAGERDTLACVAQSGGGRYFAVENEKELRGALTEATAPPPPPAPACRKQAAMWRSIGHPGLGEMLNAGQGWSGMPKRKFWLGFIPFFGWPGYLQVVSAIDAARCMTNDWPH
jgi:Ca-activated chloride channel family protein